MTVDTAVLPTFNTRREGDGHVVYVVDAGAYLYADGIAHRALTELRSGRTIAAVAGALAAELRISGQEAEERTTGLIDVLAGRRAHVGGEGRGPLLCPLSDVMGDSADRCETFGMPL